MRPYASWRQRMDPRCTSSPPTPILFSWPLRLEGMNTLHPAGGPVHELFDTLPVVAMVAASGDVKLTPDEDTADPGSEDGDESQVADGTSPTSSDKEP